MSSETNAHPSVNGDSAASAEGSHDAHSTPHSEPSHVPTHATAGTGLKIGIAAALLALGLAGGFVYGLGKRHHEEAALQTAAAESAEAPPAVQVVAVRRADARKLLTLPGEARALNETTIYARTSGYINKWLVDIGDHVKQGQTLAIIDTPELDDLLAAAKAKVVQAQSNAHLAEAAANFAKLTYERWESAAPEGVVSEQERDQKKSELDTGLAKVAAATAEIQLDQAEVHRLQTLVDFKNVIAPFDGVITQRHIDIGDLVTAGSTSSTTPLFSMARYDKLRVFVDVPQNAVPEIKDGMKASVIASEYPSHTFTGAVDRTAGAIEHASRTMRVELLVENPDLLLKPGGYVQVSFQTDRRDPPLEVPAAALTFRPGGASVAVVAPDGTVNFHSIKIAQDLGDRVEVDSGIEAGDRVALNISSDVTDGEKILAHDSSAPAPAVAPSSAAAPSARPDMADPAMHPPAKSDRSTGPTADARG